MGECSDGALVMACHAYPGAVPFGRAVINQRAGALAGVRIGTPAMAVHAAAVRHDVGRHAFWMIVDVGVAYSAVVFRLMNGVIVAMDRFEQVYPLPGRLGRLPTVAVGAVLARRRGGRSPRRPVVPAERAAVAP